MPDQAHHLRTLIRQAVAADAALAPGAPIVVVSSARPALGATTAACALATQLAALGKQTILIDANLAHPNVATHFHPPKSSTRPTNPPSPDQAWSGLCGTLTDVLSGSRRAIETLIDVSENLRILPARPNAVPSLDSESCQRFAAELAALARHADVILIDAGSGMSAWIDRLWQLAHQVMLVTTCDSATMLDAYTAVKLAQFHRLDNRLRLVFNRCHIEAEAAPWSKRFHDTCTRFLFVTPRPPATLAEQRSDPLAGVACPHRYADVGMCSADHNAPDAPFTRSARLLAADLIADARSIRLPPRVSRDAPAERASTRFMAGLTP